MWLDSIRRGHVRYRFIGSLPKGGTVLDLGCGRGELQGMLKDFRPDLRFLSVDCVDFAACFPSGTFFQVDASREPLPFESASVDAVFGSHVLEHVLSYTFLLGEVRRVLKADGALYFEAPGTRMLYSPSFCPSRGRGACCNFYDDPTHIRPLTRRALCRLGRQIGLQNLRVGFARNWWYSLLSPAMIPFCILKRDAEGLNVILWSLMGSCVYQWG